MSHFWLLRKERSRIWACFVWFCFLIIFLELALLFSIIILLLPTSFIFFCHRDAYLSFYLSYKYVQVSQFKTSKTHLQTTLLGLCDLWHPCFSVTTKCIEIITRHSKENKPNSTPLDVLCLWLNSCMKDWNCY